jgi:hypothetical protein
VWITKQYGCLWVHIQPTSGSFILFFRLMLPRPDTVRTITSRSTGSVETLTSSVRLSPVLALWIVFIE